jgi:hypothetical protein
MREFRHIGRLLLVVLLGCTLAPHLAAVSMPDATAHVHFIDEPGQSGTHDAGDHAITDHVHEAVTLPAVNLAPRWMPRARLARLEQKDLAPAPRSRMDRPPRGFG